MSRRPVVVDGSNLATEGRSLPSLAQLDEAVRAWLAENPDDEVIVVVDASFGYRIDESERQMFEEAEAAGEVVSPPAGAVGRGDGFLLRIADRVDAAVLSNDSFQEFHGEYQWLFDSGRLMGGKPVPGVGWIFTPRTPVRGPKSRMAVRDAERARKGSRSEPVVAAIEEAKAEAMEPERVSSGRRSRRRGGRAVPAESPATPPPEAVNEPLPFITFIADHRLGTEVEGRVDSFTSHGAFVEVDGARCYLPVSGLGDPPPRTAKALLRRGEVRTFVVQALDPPRRGIELALPGLARVAGSPTDETVEAEIVDGSRQGHAETMTPAPRRSRRRSAVLAASGPTPAGEAAATSEPAVPSDGASAPADDAEGEPTPRRRRAPAVVDAARSSEVVPAVPEVADEGQVPPARSRRATRKAVVPEPGESPVTPGPLPAPARQARKRPVAATPVPAEPATPAPRTPRARKKAADSAAAETPVHSAADPATPAPRTPRARKKAAESAADEVPVPSEAPVASTAELAPPPRRRAPAKKVAVTALSEEPPAPARRARKARSVEAQEAEAEAPAPDPAPVLRPRRRPRRPVPDAAE